MNIQDLISKRLGVSVSYLINPLISVALTTVQIVTKSNPNRIAWNVLNLGSNNVYILPASDVSNVNGIFLAPLGSGYMFNFMEDFILPSLSWYIIADASSPILSIEFLISV